MKTIEHSYLYKEETYRELSRGISEKVKRIGHECYFIDNELHFDTHPEFRRIKPQKLPAEFRDVFVGRMGKLQEEGRMLEAADITNEPQLVAYEIQLEMVYEHTSRQLGLPWSFATEYDYGGAKRIFPSEVLSQQAYQVYQHIMSGPEDKDFLYESVRLVGGDPKKIMEELHRGHWIEEVGPNEIKTKHPENYQQAKHFWEP